MLYKKISQTLQENTYARDSFLIKLLPEACNFIKKETLVQVFPREFCEIFKNTFFTEYLWTTTSVTVKVLFLAPPNNKNLITRMKTWNQGVFRAQSNIPVNVPSTTLDINGIGISDDIRVPFENDQQRLRLNIVLQNLFFFCEPSKIGWKVH